MNRKKDKPLPSFPGSSAWTNTWWGWLEREKTPEHIWPSMFAKILHTQEMCFVYHGAFLGGGSRLCNKLPWVTVSATVPILQQNTWDDQIWKRKAWLDHVSGNSGPWSLLAIIDFSLAARQYLVQECPEGRSTHLMAFRKQRETTNAQDLNIPPKNCDE